MKRYYRQSPSSEFEEDSFDTQDIEDIWEVGNLQEDDQADIKPPSAQVWHTYDTPEFTSVSRSRNSHPVLGNRILEHSGLRPSVKVSTAPSRFQQTVAREAPQASASEIRIALSDNSNLKVPGVQVSVSDHDALKNAFVDRLFAMNQMACKSIARDIIKFIDPNKSNNNPYPSSNNNKNIKKRKIEAPKYWPEGIQYQNVHAVPKKGRGDLLAKLFLYPLACLQKGSSDAQALLTEIKQREDVKSRVRRWNDVLKIATQKSSLSDKTVSELTHVDPEIRNLQEDKAKERRKILDHLISVVAKVDEYIEDEIDYDTVLYLHPVSSSHKKSPGAEKQSQTKALTQAPTSNHSTRANEDFYFTVASDPFLQQDIPAEVCQEDQGLAAADTNSNGSTETARPTPSAVPFQSYNPGFESRVQSQLDTQSTFSGSTQPFITSCNTSFGSAMSFKDEEVPRRFDKAESGSFHLPVVVPSHFLPSGWNPDVSATASYPPIRDVRVESQPMMVMRPDASSFQCPTHGHLHCHHLHNVGQTILRPCCDVSNFGEIAGPSAEFIPVQHFSTERPAIVNNSYFVDALGRPAVFQNEHVPHDQGAIVSEQQYNRYGYHPLQQHHPDAMLYPQAGINQAPIGTVHGYDSGIGMHDATSETMLPRLG